MIRLVSRTTPLRSSITQFNPMLNRHVVNQQFMVSRNMAFTKMFGKIVRVPGYIGGTVAAGGSYAAYKVEQASNYTQERLDTLKDFTNNIFDKTSKFFNSGDGDGGASTGGGGGDGGDTATAMGATAAAVGLSTDEDGNTDNESDAFDDETLIDYDSDADLENDDTADEMLNLTKQMIEIKNILSTIDGNNQLTLPSIVVIGSQSSGKSSVLESIVGQEFLPKGDNMVTKRPIELTLVNEPESASETAEFPALKLFNLSDFKQVQKILVDLNLAVPNSHFVSDDPIQITIRSPKVPDLSLVDLPGYIQIEAADQPIELKSKIRSLCSKYLDKPNIILAISAANVDLANSAALRAARVSDPKGERTIGVITKLDLVEPDVARSILTNKKYPLRMGYVGVITKIPQSSNSNIFSRKAISAYQSYVQQQNFEVNYFKDHKNDFLGTITGTRNLKRKLIKVLEKSMTDNLKPAHLMIQQEFEETCYKFKVEFNDLPLTPQMYLANNIDLLKLSVKELSSNLSRKELKSLLKNELDQKVLNLMAERYWNQPASFTSPNTTEPNIQELSQLSSIAEDSYWAKKLDLISSSLTKSGIGRLSTSLVTNVLIQEIENLVNNTQLRNHPKAREAVKDAAKSVLSTKYFSTVDQVENCIKPYKYEIELEDKEWAVSKENAENLLKQEIKQCDNLYTNLKNQIGGRKLQQVIKYLNKLNQQQLNNIDFNSNETLGFSHNLIEKGKVGIFLQDRLSLLKMRYQFVKNSKKCKKKENKYQCPEIYLDAITNKLTTTSVLFLNVELLNDFYYNFPRELDVKFFNNLSLEQIEEFAKEDPKIKSHVDLQQRKDMLELALNKMENLLAIKKTLSPQNNSNDSIFTSWIK